MSTKVYDSTSNSITDILDASEVSFIKSQGDIKIIPKDDASHIVVKEVVTRPDGIKVISLENGDNIEVSPAGPHTLIRNPETVKSEQEAKAKAEEPAQTQAEFEARGEPLTADEQLKADQKAAEAKLKAAPAGPIAGMQTSSNAPA